jgi:putative ABC transport system permease protein
MLNLIAGIIALTLYQVFRPSLIELSGTPPAFSFWTHPYNWLIFLGILVSGSFLAGLYPAFVLSSFQPATVLNGKMSTGTKGINLRKGLVIFQFSISTLLVAGTLAVFQQLQFMQSQDLGVTLDQTLVVRGPAAVDSTYRPRQDAFHEALERNPKISTLAASSTIPGNPEFSNAGGVRHWGAPESEGNTVAFMWIDHGFMDLFEIGIEAGRNFEKGHFVDTNRVMLNVNATQLFGFDEPGDAIGKELYFWGNRVQVVGVVKDYHQKSLKVADRPMIFRYWPYLTSFHSMRVNTSDLPATLAFVEETFRQQFPNNPYEYFFADEYFDRQYHADQKFSKVFTAFSLLAILIACLGLFGLASYALSRRSKEMGIRKVLGASISQLTILISREFVLLVLISNVLALPLAVWGISNWLTNFPYRMELQWTLFVIPFFLILIVALLTISSQTFKAANTNPVEALRSE